MSFSDGSDTASERHMEHILPRKLTEPKNRGLEDVFPSIKVMFRFRISFPGVGCIEIELQPSEHYFFELQPSKTRSFPKKTRGHLGSRYTHILFLFEFVWEG